MDDEQKEDYTALSLAGIANGLYVSSHHRGTVAGWQEAAKYLRSLAGEEYAAGRDAKAEHIRSVAIMLELQAKEVEKKFRAEYRAVEDGYWAEIERRDEEEKKGTGEQST